MIKDSLSNAPALQQVCADGCTRDDALPVEVDLHIPAAPHHTMVKHMQSMGRSAHAGLGKMHRKAENMRVESFTHPKSHLNQALVQPELAEPPVPLLCVLVWCGGGCMGVHACAAALATATTPTFQSVSCCHCARSWHCQRPPGEGLIPEPASTHRADFVWYGGGCKGQSTCNPAILHMAPYVFCQHPMLRQA